jgi:hypothetical protein
MLERRICDPIVWCYEIKCDTCGAYYRSQRQSEPCPLCVNGPPESGAISQPRHYMIRGNRQEQAERAKQVCAMYEELSPVWGRKTTGIVARNMKVQQETVQSIVRRRRNENTRF